MITINHYYIPFTTQTHTHIHSFLRHIRVLIEPGNECFDALNLRTFQVAPIKGHFYPSGYAQCQNMCINECIFMPMLVFSENKCQVSTSLNS